MELISYSRKTLTARAVEKRSQDLRDLFAYLKSEDDGPADSDEAPGTVRFGLGWLNDSGVLQHQIVTGSVSGEWGQEAVAELHVWENGQTQTWCIKSTPDQVQFGSQPDSLQAHLEILPTGGQGQVYDWKFARNTLPTICS